MGHEPTGLLLFKPCVCHCPANQHHRILIMPGIEARLLILYEKSVIPSLTYNYELWTLSPSEEKHIEQIRICALKRLFGNPTTTPNSAVIHTLGQLFMTQEKDKKRFMLLYKILSRNTDHWTNKMLRHLQTRNLGWAKNIQEKIVEYQLGLGENQ